MPEDEVGRLNLALLDSLIKRKQAEDNKARLNAGIVAAAIINSAPFGDANRTLVKATDYLPESAQEKRPELDLTTLTPIQQKLYFMSIFMKRNMG